MIKKKNKTNEIKYLQFGGKFYEIIQPKYQTLKTNISTDLSKCYSRYFSTYNEHDVNLSPRKVIFVTDIDSTKIMVLADDASDIFTSVGYQLKDILTKHTGDNKFHKMALICGDDKQYSPVIADWKGLFVKIEKHDKNIIDAMNVAWYNDKPMRPWRSAQSDWKIEIKNYNTEKLNTKVNYSTNNINIASDITKVSDFNYNKTLDECGLNVAIIWFIKIFEIISKQFSGEDKKNRLLQQFRNFLDINYGCGRLYLGTGRTRSKFNDSWEGLGEYLIDNPEAPNWEGDENHIVTLDSVDLKKEKKKLSEKELQEVFNNWNNNKPLNLTIKQLNHNIKLAIKRGVRNELIDNVINDILKPRMVKVGQLELFEQYNKEFEKLKDIEKQKNEFRPSSSPEDPKIKEVVDQAVERKNKLAIALKYLPKAQPQPIRKPKEVTTMNPEAKFGKSFRQLWPQNGVLTRSHKNIKHEDNQTKDNPRRQTLRNGVVLTQSNIGGRKSRRRKSKSKKRKHKSKSKSKRRKSRRKKSKYRKR